MTSELETHLVSVERVKEYSETATEVNSELEKKKTHKFIPQMYLEASCIDPGIPSRGSVCPYLEINNKLQIKVHMKNKNFVKKF